MKNNLMAEFNYLGRRIIKIAILIIAFFLIRSFPQFERSFNSSIDYLIQSSVSEFADSNIVLITIDQNDVEKLGGWPLRRNYYALLLSELQKLNPRVIGFEILLGRSLSAQSVYNSLLNEVILNSENIILGSLADNIYLEEGIYKAERISYPNPKIDHQNINTGHLNYISKNRLVIPSAVLFDEKPEKSFSGAIVSAIGDLELEREQIVNINKSWKLYRKYSVIDFFTLIENKSTGRLFSNKIVLIGVSDPSITKSVQSSFDTLLPGIGFHAIAVDNLINGESLDNSYYVASATIFLTVLIILTLFSKLNRFLLYSVTTLVYGTVAAILLLTFYTEINHSVFVLPFILLIVADLYFYQTSRDKSLAYAVSEKVILEKALAKKEKDLAGLQKQLDLSPESTSSELSDKITKLKSQIDELKASEADEESADISQRSEGTKNFHGIIFSSNKMGKVADLIEKVAPQNATVLILGESGSGKELVAHAIHDLSERRDKKFVAVNCAALSDTLLESELFGHIKGAFTNAVGDKKGLFEAADQGTIFLDEIGETSENFQVKMLRVLQSGEIQKVGSTDTIKVDVRVVAATNKNLELLVKNGKFREDLYFRLNVISVGIPPLRERREDIKPMVDHFLDQEEEEFGISKAVLNNLMDYDWKGNVRELQSVITRAVIFAKGDARNLIKISDLPEELADLSKSDLENLILESLREKEFSHSSINETAAELGNLSRTIVSENFRGIFFKEFCRNGHNLEKASELIADTENQEIIGKVRSKGERFVSNITKDLKKFQESSFDEIKKGFSSKYKNLPQRYHKYLDEIIEKIIQKPED